MNFFVRTPTPKLLTVRIHPRHVTQSMRGRPGATIIIPAIGMQERSELKEHLAIVNERNKLTQPITEARLEEAVERRIKKNEFPHTTQQLLAMGLRPGEHRRIRK